MQKNKHINMFFENLFLILVNLIFKFLKRFKIIDTKMIKAVKSNSPLIGQTLSFLTIYRAIYICNQYNFSVITN